MGRLRRALADADAQALRAAVRAAVVMPAVFAFGEVVVDDGQVALFGAFGSLGFLVFAQFGGPRRARLVANFGLALGGAGLVVLGTVTSGNAWLGAATMAAVGFLILFSGVIDGYFAAAGTAAILAFVLSTMVPAAIADIPSRLAGWGLGAGVAIAAVTLVWPTPLRDELRTRLAATCRALAALVDAADTDDAALHERLRSDVSAKLEEARLSFTATPARQTGPTARQAAVAKLADDLGWMLGFTLPPAEAPTFRPEFAAEWAEMRSAVSAALLAAADRFEGGAPALDVERLAHARDDVRRAFPARVELAVAERDGAALDRALHHAFQLRALGFACTVMARHAALATDAPDPAPDPTATRLAARSRSAAAALGELLTAHASMRSVWFRNSLRGAAGLAIAVLVAQLADLQHGFWVVLGTLSVLRSQALATGTTIVQALAGTTVGIVVGGAIVFAVGDSTEALWAILPLVTLVAAYAPRAISFAAGQAAFSVVVLVLFDIIAPEGWSAGLVRVEDVAIGCGISLVAGLLFWPRGAAGALREAIATAYTRGVGYLSATVAALLDGGDEMHVQRAAQQAMAADDRLDDAFRQFLAERVTARDRFGDLAALVVGATRMRRIGYVMGAGSALMPLSDGVARIAGAHAAVDAELASLQRWFGAFDDALRTGRPAPAPQPGHEAAAEGAVLQRITEGECPDRESLTGALAVAWALHDLSVARSVEARVAPAFERLRKLREGAEDKPIF
jgi:uncharacterized membrane protein YccC